MDFVVGQKVVVVEAATGENAMEEWVEKGMVGVVEGIAVHGDYPYKVSFDGDSEAFASYEIRPLEMTNV